MRNLYVDVAANVDEGFTPDDAALVVQRIRQLGAQRVLYGSDPSVPGGTIAKGWEIFRTRLPLTDVGLQQIMNNRTRFVR